MTFSNNTWRLIFGATGAVAAFLLVQQDVALDPLARVLLGAITTVLAVLNPNRAS